MSQDFVYIDEDNRAYIHGKVNKLCNQNEMLENIKYRIKTHSSLPTGCGSCSGILGLLISLMFLIPATYVLLSLIYSLSMNVNSNRFRVDDLAIVMSIGAASFIVLVLGGRNFIKAFNLLLSPNHSEIYFSNLAKKHYKDLVKQGRIIEGQITEFNQEEEKHSVHYKFKTPDGLLTEGVYFTSVNKILHVGDKVQVLYLNNIINILL